MNDWAKILIPKIRQVIPSLIAQDICSVQPMTGPTGSVFSMGINRRELTWQETIEGYNGRSTEYITDTMQEKYPGPYTIQQRYDSERGGWYYTMEWEDDADRVFWILKNT